MNDIFTPNELEQVFNIFKRNEIETTNISDLTLSTKRKWFNNILKEFEIFGINENINSNNLNEINNQLIINHIYQYQNTVSINNFCILEVNGLYRHSFLHFYPENYQWSHPGILKLLKIYDDKFILNNIKNKELKYNIKLFINLILGMLFNTNLNNSSLPLKIEGLYNFEIFKNKTKIFMLELIKEINQTKNLVCFDVDEILLSVNSKEVDFNHLINNHFNLSSDPIKILNKICRKFNIDITQ